MIWDREPSANQEVEPVSRSVRPLFQLKAEDCIMGNQHDQNNQNKPDDLNRQNQQGGQSGNQQGGGAGQQIDKDRQQQGGQGGRSGGQIDDNQDDMGQDVNNPGKAGNDINKTM
jgi:hypothetical protein